MILDNRVFDIHFTTTQLDENPFQVCSDWEVVMEWGNCSLWIVNISQSNGRLHAVPRNIPTWSTLYMWPNHWDAYSQIKISIKATCYMWSLYMSHMSHVTYGHLIHVNIDAKVALVGEGVDLFVSKIWRRIILTMFCFFLSHFSSLKWHKDPRVVKK